MTPAVANATPDGPVVAGVLAGLDGLPGAQSRPGLAMARLLDDKRLSTARASAQRQRSATLDRLHAAHKVARGRLAAVGELSPAERS